MSARFTLRHLKWSLRLDDRYAYPLNPEILSRQCIYIVLSSEYGLARNGIGQHQSDYFIRPVCSVPRNNRSWRLESFVIRT